MLIVELLVDCDIILLQFNKFYVEPNVQSQYSTNR